MNAPRQNFNLFALLRRQHSNFKHYLRYVACILPSLYSHRTQLSILDFKRLLSSRDRRKLRTEGLQVAGCLHLFDQFDALPPINFSISQ